MNNAPTRRTDKVAEKIGRAIAAGRLKAGATLPSDKVLCATHSVSRIVLREALRILGAKGMVRAIPKAGTFICPRAQWALYDPTLLHWMEAETPPEQRIVLLHQLLDMRLMVDPGAAALAASRLNNEARQKISAQFAHLHHSEMALAAEAEQAFFALIRDGAGNPFLAPFHAMSGLTYRLMAQIGHRYQPDFECEAHEQLTRAIMNHDAPASRQAAQAILLTSYVQTEKQEVKRDTKREADGS